MVGGRIGNSLAKVPVPPLGKDTYLNYEKLLSKNVCYIITCLYTVIYVADVPFPETTSVR